MNSCDEEIWQPSARPVPRLEELTGGASTQAQAGDLAPKQGAGILLLQPQSGAARGKA